MRPPVAEPNTNPNTITPKELLELAAGDRCPCGHTSQEHDTRPAPNLGPCHKCQCEGMIDAT